MNRRLCLDDYAEIVEPHDEWEGLIGIVVDFLDEEGMSRRADCQQITHVVLHIPTYGDAQRRTKLRDINEISSYVRSQLRGDDDHATLPIKRVAWFDPEEL